MFCPNCGEEFRWDVMVCPTCDVDTVDRLPGPEPTPDVDLVCVLATGDPGLVAVAKSLLEGDDLDFFVRGENLQNMFGLPAGGPTEFWVRSDDAARAHGLLDDLTAGTDNR
jgi:putative signal transducing protein